MVFGRNGKTFYNSLEARKVYTLFARFGARDTWLIDMEGAAWSTIDPCLHHPRTDARTVSPTNFDHFENNPFILFSRPIAVGFMALTAFFSLEAKSWFQTELGCREKE